MDYSAFQNIKIQFKFSTFPMLVFPFEFYVNHNIFYTYNIFFIPTTFFFCSANKRIIFLLGGGVHIPPAHFTNLLFLITLKLVNKNRGFWKLKHILGKPSLFPPPPR